MRGLRQSRSELTVLSASLFPGEIQATKRAARLSRPPLQTAVKSGELRERRLPHFLFIYFLSQPLRYLLVPEHERTVSSEPRVSAAAVSCQTNAGAWLTVESGKDPSLSRLPAEDKSPVKHLSDRSPRGVRGTTHVFW